MPVINSTDYKNITPSTIVPQEMMARFDYTEGSGQFTTETVSGQSFNRGTPMQWGSDGFGTYIHFPVYLSGFSYASQANFTAPWATPTNQYSTSSWLFSSNWADRGMFLWVQPPFSNYGATNRVALGPYAAGATMVNLSGQAMGYDLTPYNNTVLHLVTTCDGGSVAYYVNGVLISSAILPDPQLYGTADWAHLDATRYMSEFIRIYDSSIWSGVFSQADITALYNAGRSY